MRFGVLGPLTVWTSTGGVVTVPGRKVRALLADLLVHERQPVSTDRLVADLWADHPPGNPIGALQAKVSQLRRVLGDAEPGGRGLIDFSDSGYRLRTDADAVDAGRFLTLVSRSRHESEPAARAALLTEALALWRGPAYADLAAELFTVPAAHRLEEQRLAALEDLAEARLALGDHTLLVGELEDLVAAHPLRERLRAALMRALYRSGRQSEALASFEELRRRLRDELGLDPSPELVKLQQAVLRQDPQLRPPPARPAPAGQARTNLPSPVSGEPDGGLVGRGEEIAQTQAQLAAGRLVTLTGPGGVGKTSVAAAVARTLVADSPDGAWLVELVSQSTAGDSAAIGESIAATIAAVLGVREDPGAEPDGTRSTMVERLAASLRPRRLLLVLDGCEHVVDPISRLTSRLLAAAPGLRVLATSQEPLGLADEITLPVPPLGVPSADATAAELADTDAVRLFVKRAAAAAPGFALTDGNAAAVATICRRLDGIPLALELAATRVRALDVVELAKRLDDRFRLLSAGSRSAPARQRTLRAVLDWSWELLPARERAVLRRLVVHADGCTLTAAEQTAAGGEVAAEDVLDLLARLVDRSLVTVRDGGGERRYRLLESVAAYCWERLAEAGEADSARQRHADYYLQLAESSEPKLRGHAQHQVLRLLDSENGNLRAAIQHTTARGLAVPALRLVNSLAWYWFLRGRLPEARRALTTALAIEPGHDPAPPAIRARTRAWLAGLGFLDYHEADPAVSRRAVLARYREVADPAGEAYAKWLFAFTMMGSGDVTVANSLATEALAAFRQLGDRWGIAAALTVRADLGLIHGDLAAVERDCQDSRALFTELGDRWGTLYPTDLLGRLAAIRGDYDRAARLHRDALRVAEQLQLWPVASRQLASLGRLSLLTGDLGEATEYHERALRIAEEQSHGSAAAFAGTGLALGDRRLGRLDRAEVRQRELLEWNRRVNYLPGCALAMAELGFIAELRHDAEAAGRWHADGLAAARQTGDPRAVALALEGLAGVSVLVGRPDRAARLLGAAAAAREAAGASLPAGERADVDRIGQSARAGLGERQFAVHLGQGRELSLADAVALAAETVDGKPGISGR